MSAPENKPFPLVELQAVCDARYAWVALLLTPVAIGEQEDASLLAALTLLNAADVFGLLAPLDLVIPLAAPARLELAQLSALPPNRVILRVPAVACDDLRAQKKLASLAEAGYRTMIEGVTPGSSATLCGARALMVDAATTLPPMVALVGQPGPHLAINMPSEARIAACAEAGFSWFMGDFASNPERDNPGDGTTPKRLLALLGLLARDADTCELEVLLKQDPSLSYHLLKLVNSAAFALSSPVHSFSQAINVLGRRQLQRWLQLLLYARQQQEQQERGGGLPNPLLPLAAVRAAQMEALVRAQGGDRDRQDMAFVAGVFSLLDVLLGMTMTEIVAALSLDLEVVMALLDRTGPLGELLKLVEGHDRAALAKAGIDAEAFWQTQLQAHQWALQVSRSL